LAIAPATDVATTVETLWKRENVAKDMPRLSSETTSMMYALLEGSMKAKVKPLRIDMRNNIGSSLTRIRATKVEIENTYESRITFFLPNLSDRKPEGSTVKLETSP
jgi:RNA processing factor Prp31